MLLRVFGGVSMNNYKTDVMKSGLQKYIRRGELEKSLYCMVELDLFKMLDDKKVKGLRSNMRNRLIVTLVEDCGISDWRIYERVNELFKLWEENRRCKNNSERKYMVEILEYMNRSEKIRLCSWVKCYFGYGYKDESMKKYYEGVDLEKSEDKIGEKFYKKGDSNEIKKMIDGIVYNLNEDSDNVFYWVLKILDSKEKCGRRNRRSKKGFIVFDILNEYIKEEKLKKLKEIHENWYINNDNSRGEGILFVLNLCLFYLRRKEINWEEKLEKVEVSDERVKEIYDRNMKKNYKFELDDYICDMHCMKGKMNGKNEKDFAKYGSVVNNEYGKFVVEKYKNIYNEMKIMKGNEKNKKKGKKNKKKVEKKKKVVKKRKKKINNKLEEDLDFVDFKELMGIKKVEDLNEKMCRKGTCGGKAMTFFNKEKGIIVKEMRKSFNYGRDCCVLDEVKDIFGIKKMNCRRVKSNMIVKKKDKKIKLWENNMEIKEEDCVYLLMDIFENEGTLVKNKKRKIDKKIDFLKIVLFRGIFRVTDTNYTNVLVNKEGELLSIDENNIGDREKMMDRRMSKCYNKEEVDSVVKDLLENKEEKLKIIKEKLEKYELDFYKMVEERLNNVKEIIYKEFEEVLKVKL